MKISYIYHSGFLVETQRACYIFDYYKGALPISSEGRKKPILVFASHAHRDHYNPEIFTLLQKQGLTDITAVLAKDISSRKYPEGIPVIRVSAHREYALPDGSLLYTLLSTDAGVAFLLRTEEGMFYHAGDLNDWYWEEAPEQENKQMTGSYRHEIDLLRNRLEGRSLTTAFVPLDPRLGAAYSRGLLYFLKKVNASSIYPMHYWEQPDVIGRFLQEYPEYAEVIRQTE